MARSDALLKITKTLVSRRQELRKRLGIELNDLGVPGSTTSGDSADAAFEHSGEEIASQLAMVEARELAQVEHAIARIKQGKYGVCAGCGCKIPVIRLNTLPYSTFCIKCQREVEHDSSWLDSHAQVDWDKVRDTSSDDREVDLADLEIDVRK